MSERTEDAWLDFLEGVRDARHILGKPEDRVWYRGHSSSHYKLIPSLHRFDNGLEREMQLFEEFERSAARLFEKREDDWETLFDMQHYGIPSRLLDWTEALGVAVAFAVLDRHETDEDSAVFVLDPEALNGYSGLDSVKRVTEDDFKYKAVYWDNKPFAAGYPIAIAPPLNNDRMFAQRGTFTVHGRDGRSLEEMCPTAIVKIPLPQTAIQGAEEFLTYSNLNAYSIYPDILGMARHIRRRHFGALPIAAPDGLEIGKATWQGSYEELRGDDDFDLQMTLSLTANSRKTLEGTLKLTGEKSTFLQIQGKTETEPQSDWHLQLPNVPSPDEIQRFFWFSDSYASGDRVQTGGVYRCIETTEGQLIGLWFATAESKIPAGKFTLHPVS